MADKTKTREITITDDKGTFSVFFKRFAGGHEYDFEGLSSLRSILSNEKAKLLHIIKTKNPSSIYSLAKLAQRDFKSVSEDIKTLEKFGFIDLITERTGKRERLKPVIVIDTIRIDIKI